MTHNCRHDYKTTICRQNSMTNLSRQLGGGLLKYKVDVIPLLERVDELGVAKLIVSVESVGGGGERSWLEVKSGDLITGTHVRTCSSKSNIWRRGRGLVMVQGVLKI